MKLDDVKKLHQKKYRTQLGFYLVEGEHLILELQKAMNNRNDTSQITVYLTQEYERWASRLGDNFTLSLVSQKQMQRISDTKTPPGIIARVPMPSAHNNAKTTQPITETSLESNDKKKPRFIYLHEIQDPGNLGTILRTLAWFGNFQLLLSPNSVDPFNPKVVRASMGAIFHVPIELEVDISSLESRFSTFAYLDMQGAPVNTKEFADFECYLFGNEARGVPHNSVSTCRTSAFTIAGSGNIDSLNLASAVNICVYQLSLGINVND